MQSKINWNFCGCYSLLILNWIPRFCLYFTLLLQLLKTSTWTLTVTKLSNHSKWVKKATFNEFLFNNLKVNKSCLKSGSQVLVLMIGAPLPASGWAQLTLYNIYQWLMTLHSLLSALSTSPQVVHRSFFIDFQNLHPFTDKCSVFRWVNFDQNRLNIFSKTNLFCFSWRFSWHRFSMKNVGGIFWWWGQTRDQRWLFL